MRNENFRKALAAYVEERGIQESYGDVILLENHTYDNSIVGITDTGILVYDYNKMVEEFAADENCDEDDAIDWVDYNTMRELSARSGRRPIVIMHTTDSIMDDYGD